MSQSHLHVNEQTILYLQNFLRKKSRIQYPACHFKNFIQGRRAMQHSGYGGVIFAVPFL